jgi:hypothetical protein
MADYKVIQVYVSAQTIKRIESQPEKKKDNLSLSKVGDILIREALSAREEKLNEIKEKIK